MDKSVKLFLSTVLILAFCPPISAQGQHHKAFVNHYARPAAPKAVSDQEQEGLFRPIFHMKREGQFSAGKAWCTTLKSRQILAVTSLHLFGPAGGELATQVPANEIAAKVVKVDLVSFVNGRVVAITRTALSQSGFVARGYDFSGDAVFFLLPPAVVGIKTFTIAEKPASIGERCWFYTCSDEDSAAHQIPGTVVHSSHQLMMVKLDKPLAVSNTSGSPILNREGKVIGMMCGHNERTGYLICNPGFQVARRIAADTNQKSNKQKNIRTIAN